MNYIKAILLVVLMLFFGLLAFIVALPAILTGQRWKFLNQVFLKPFGYSARAVVGIKLTVLNEPGIRSRRPAVLMGNHQSGLDLAVVGSVCPQGSIVVGKKEIAQIPIVGWWWRASGNLFIDRSNPIAAKQSLNNTAVSVREHGLNVAIFPEGTRNTGKAPGLLPFKKGGFHLAKELRVPVIPVICSSLKGKGIWEAFELNGGPVIISILEPVETTDWTDQNLNEKIVQVQKLMSDEFERISALAASKEVG